ncbi:MAG TPA: AAA family ATPase [Candidatus Dorea intestinavium]|nr:AAA family ATPase [Candidatus Dorea intestinavium]
MYLERFTFPDAEQEFDFFLEIKRKCYDSFYPFQVLGDKELGTLNFELITVLYGGNGSGKTTALNVIAERLGLERATLYNRTIFFEDYINLCDYQLKDYVTNVSRIITSDDVFDFMLNLRTINNGISVKREDLFEEYLDAKYANFQLKSLDDYEKLKKVNLARSKTQSKFVRKSLMGDVREQSNGESAFMYFADKIKDNGLYLLDEPENSLSPERQQELLKFLEESARFFGCQFIIATHSPFLLSIKGAKIYDLDSRPVVAKKWTELANVKTYYEFFKRYEKEFE